jgi:hypothetical protein
MRLSDTWIIGEDVMEQFGLTAHELYLRIFEDNIAVYRDMHESTHIQADEIDFNFEAKGVEFDNRYIENLYFKITTVQGAFGGEANGSGGQIEKEQTIESKRVPQPTHSFIKAGEAYVIEYEGRRLVGLKGVGFDYIHTLISYPHHNLSASELYRRTRPTPSIDTVSKAACSDASLHKGVSMQQSTDEKTLKQISERHREIKQEIATAEREGDSLVFNELKTEKEGIEKYLRETVSPHKRIRAIRDDDTKLQDSITKAINRAIKKLEGQNDIIGAHFVKALRPVTPPFCYRPDQKFHWKTV